MFEFIASLFELFYALFLTAISFIGLIFLYDTYFASASSSEDSLIHKNYLRIKEKLESFMSYLSNMRSRAFSVKISINETETPSELKESREDREEPSQSALSNLKDKQEQEELLRSIQISPKNTRREVTDIEDQTVIEPKEEVQKQKEDLSVTKDLYIFDKINNNEKEEIIKDSFFVDFNKNPNLLKLEKLQFKTEIKEEISYDIGSLVMKLGDKEEFLAALRNGTPIGYKYNYYRLFMCRSWIEPDDYTFVRLTFHENKDNLKVISSKMLRVDLNKDNTLIRPKVILKRINVKVKSYLSEDLDIEYNILVNSQDYAFLGYTSDIEFLKGLDVKDLLKTYLIKMKTNQNKNPIINELRNTITKVEKIDLNKDILKERINQNYSRQNSALRVRIFEPVEVYKKRLPNMILLRDLRFLKCFDFFRPSLTLQLLYGFLYKFIKVVQSCPILISNFLMITLLVYSINVLCLQIISSLISKELIPDNVQELAKSFFFYIIDLLYLIPLRCSGSEIKVDDNLKDGIRKQLTLANVLNCLTCKDIDVINKLNNSIQDTDAKNLLLNIENKISDAISFGLNWVLDTSTPILALVFVSITLYILEITTPNYFNCKLHKNSKHVVFAEAPISKAEISDFEAYYQERNLGLNLINKRDYNNKMSNFFQLNCLKLFLNCLSLHQLPSIYYYNEAEKVNIFNVPYRTYPIKNYQEYYAKNWYFFNKDFFIAMISSFICLNLVIKSEDPKVLEKYENSMPRKDRDSDFNFEVAKGKAEFAIFKSYYHSIFDSASKGIDIVMSIIPKRKDIEESQNLNTLQKLILQATFSIALVLIIYYSIKLLDYNTYYTSFVCQYLTIIPLAYCIDQFNNIPCIVNLRRNYCCRYFLRVIEFIIYQFVYIILRASYTLFRIAYFLFILVFNIIEYFAKFLLLLPYNKTIEALKGESKILAYIVAFLVEVVYVLCIGLLLSKLN